MTGLPQWLSGNESVCSAGDAGDMGLIPGLGRSPGRRHDSPLQYSCTDSPWTEGLVGYSPWSRRELDVSEVSEHTHAV